MKNVILLFLILFSSVLYAQELAGDWNGTLHVQGIELKLVFHISKTEDKWKATMDSPAQNAYGIPVSRVDPDLPKVRIELSNLGAVYEGTLSDTQITGKWMQSGQVFDLILSKTERKP